MIKIFIPVKEHSQRVPHKNFRFFGDRPLWLRAAEKFAEIPGAIVYVNTDSEEIQLFLSSKGSHPAISVIHRRKELCGDDVSVNLLIEDFVHTDYCEEEDVVVQLHATNPFLKAETVIGALRYMDKGYDSVVSCNVIQSRLWREESYGYCPVNHNPMKLLQTQSLPKICEENSCFYIFTPHSFLARINRIGQNPYFYPIAFPENLDIDTEDDWEMALLLSKQVS